MWKEFFNLLRQVFTLTESTEQNKQKIKQLSEQLDELTSIVQQIRFDLEQMKKDTQHTQEKLLLQLENRLLRHQLKLAPPKAKPADEDQT